MGKTDPTIGAEIAEREENSLNLGARRKAEKVLFRTVWPCYPCVAAEQGKEPQLVLVLLEPNSGSELCLRILNEDQGQEDILQKK